MRPPKQPKKAKLRAQPAARQSESAASMPHNTAAGGEISHFVAPQAAQDTVETAPLSEVATPDAPKVRAAAKKVRAGWKFPRLLPLWCSGANMRKALRSLRNSGKLFPQLKQLKQLKNAGNKNRSQKAWGKKIWQHKASQHSTPQSAISLSARIAEKKNERRRVFLRRLGLITGILSAAVFMIWLVFFAPFARFAAQETAIQGAKEESLIDLSQVHNILRKYDGTPLVLLRYSGVVKELQEIPQVATADFEISLFAPVKLKLEDAQPAFCLVQGETCQAINEKGEPIQAEAPDLENTLRLGQIPDGKSQAQVVRQTLALLKLLDPEVKQQLSQIDLSPAGQFTFQLTGGRSVNWGVSGKNEVKAKILKALLSEEGKTHFDVSVPEAPVAS